MCFRLKWKDGPISNCSFKILNIKNKTLITSIKKRSRTAAPALAERLVEIGLSQSTRPYTAVDAIKTSLAFLQVGVMDRENKKKIEQLFKSIDELEGNPNRVVDV